MSNFEPWRAVRPSAPTPTGQDPLAEALRNAVNAFGDPSKTYTDGNNVPANSKTKLQSAYYTAATVNQSQPVTPEQSRKVATLTTNQQSTPNVNDAAHQQLSPLSQVIASVAREPEPQDISPRALRATLAARLATGQTRTSQQPLKSVSKDGGQHPLSKRRRIVGTEVVTSQTPALPSIPLNRGLVIPQGAENCLTGCIFIFSGELPNLSRPRATRLIEQHDGEVTLIPDEFTTHSVLGHGVSRSKITILDSFRITPLDETGLLRMIQEMPANGHWEESPIREPQQQPILAGESNTPAMPSAEAMGEDTVQTHCEVAAPFEDIVQVTSDDRTEQSWPFNEPPNLVRHIPNTHQTQQIETLVKDESTDVPLIDAPPTVNVALRRQYAESWGTPQVKRGELTKIKFGVNYEKGESRLVKREIRRRGGKVVRISQADILVELSHSFSVSSMHTILNYRPDWQIMSKKFLEAFPPLEVLSFSVSREDASTTTIPAAQSPSSLEGATTSHSRISRAQARYEDLIAQRNAFVAVRDRRIRQAERKRNYYDSDFEETPEVEENVDNEKRSFRPPSPAVPPIMDEVASDGYASSCDEHEIHRAIIHSTKRMKPAKVKKGFLIQAKLVLRGPNGATVNALNGKPGVTRLLRVPANTSFRQLTDVLNTAFGWAGDKEWDILISTNLGKWSTVEPLPSQFAARVTKTVTQQSSSCAMPDQQETYIRAREIRLFDVWGRHQPRQCQNLQVWYNYHADSHWAHQISFLGEANDRLFEASRMEEDRKYWCIAGEGHAHPEDHPGKLDKWRGKTNLWAWDMAKINKELGVLEENSLHNR